MLQLARWRQVSPAADDDEPLPEAAAALLARCVEALPDAGSRALVEASARSYARDWRRHFSREHDIMAIRGERNAFRYRPCRRVIARGSAAAPETAAALCQVALAACVAGTPLTVSLPPDAESWRWLEECEGVNVAVETDAGFVERLAHPGDAERVRAGSSLPSPRAPPPTARAWP